MVVQPIIEVPVLVVGGGPVGQLAALQLAQNGVHCMLVERNDTTTQYPKMEYLNMRSMELLHRMGLADRLREIGVPGHYDLTVLYSNGLSEGGETFAQWDLPSPDDKMKQMRQTNDGTALSQTYLRSTQIVVEAELQKHIQSQTLVDSRWGTKFESLTEVDNAVMSDLTDSRGNVFTVKSKYVIGCDGAGSRVRRQMANRSLNGEYVPANVYMVYFRSKDLEKLHRQGRFWHIIFSNNCVLIAQDEKELWLVHSIFPPDFDLDTLNPEETVQRALGGSLQPTDIVIDEILSVGTWRPGIFVMDNYRSEGGKVFLAGDAAHQRIPTGGFGLNTGVGDAYDIGWKLASVLSGHAGPQLLDSYDLERRPVAARNTAIALESWLVHTTWWKWLEENPSLIAAQSEEGRALRQRCGEHLRSHDRENQDFGIESDYRYNGSPVIIADNEVAEPPSSRSCYTASTWPGARAPAVFLKDGRTNMHDRFGTGLEYTLVDFSQDDRRTTAFRDTALAQHVPLRIVHLPGEEYVRSIYERDAVLIRPDGHVAWRCGVGGGDFPDAAKVLQTACGKAPATSAIVEGVAQALRSN